MPREVIEYRAVGVDSSESDETKWTTRDWAEKGVEDFLDADPPFDEVFLERRTVVYGEPERVKEGEDA